MYFLRACLDALFPPRITSLAVSESTVESLGSYVSPTTYETANGPITFLLPYRIPAVRALIVEAKFHETSRAIGILGQILAEYLATLGEEAPFESPVFVLVPVPLSKKRFRERGYNQSERVVRTALERLPVGFSIDMNLLKRVRDTPPQTTLGRRARLHNLTGAFTANSSLIGETTYILVDDVSTTGATLNTCANALRKEGAEKILLLALAH